jgi:hypothetical protein
MPQLNKQFFMLLQDDKIYPTFVETGTSEGNTIFSVESLFDHVYTIEIEENILNETKKYYKGNKINFILGDSILVLQNLIPTLTTNTIFYLDAHFIPSNTTLGLKKVPILEEVYIISQKCKYDAVIIINNFRMFGTNYKEDWTDITLEKVLELTNNRAIKHYNMPSDLAKDDRLIIHLKSI